MRHIEFCLREFETVRAHARRPGEVELALWFHDAIYDPRASDNEEKSAQLAFRVLTEASLSRTMAERVARLIRATRHDQCPRGADARIVADVDLSILGQSKARFAAYEKRIRKEYGWVPEQKFRAGRIAFLRLLLNRSNIFSTLPFRRKYERLARIKLEQSIASLNSQ